MDWLERGRQEDMRAERDMAWDRFRERRSPLDRLRGSLDGEHVVRRHGDLHKPKGRHPDGTWRTCCDLTYDETNIREGTDLTCAICKAWED